MGCGPAPNIHADSDNLQAAMSVARSPAESLRQGQNVLSEQDLNVSGHFLLRPPNKSVNWWSFRSIFRLTEALTRMATITPCFQGCKTLR